MTRISSRKLLFAVVALGFSLMLVDHLASPPLHASTGGGETACAPCGAPCPSTR